MTLRAPADIGSASAARCLLPSASQRRTREVDAAADVASPTPPHDGASRGVPVLMATPGWMRSSGGQRAKRFSATAALSSEVSAGRFICCTCKATVAE